MNDKKLTTLVSEFYRKPITGVSIELSLTISLVVLLAVFAIKPTLETMGKLSKEIGEKTILDEKLKQKAVALNTAQTEYLSRQDKLSSLDDALPSKDTTVRDLKIIEKIAYQSNVMLITASLPSFPATKAQGGKNEVFNQPLSLTVEGDYVSIKNFVANLISNRRVFVINSITFSIRKQRGAGESLSASISVNCPFYF